jgi:hypothetical protein
MRPVSGSDIAVTNTMGFRQAIHCGGTEAPLGLGELSVIHECIQQINTPGRPRLLIMSVNKCERPNLAIVRFKSGH